MVMESALWLTVIADIKSALSHLHTRPWKHGSCLPSSPFWCGKRVKIYVVAAGFEANLGYHWICKPWLQTKKALCFQEQQKCAQVLEIAIFHIDTGKCRPTRPHMLDVQIGSLNWRPHPFAPGTCLHTFEESIHTHLVHF